MQKKMPLLAARTALFGAALFGGGAYAQQAPTVQEQTGLPGSPVAAPADKPYVAPRNRLTAG